MKLMLAREVALVGLAPVLRSLVLGDKDEVAMCAIRTRKLVRGEVHQVGVTLRPNLRAGHIKPANDNIRAGRSTTNKAMALSAMALAGVVTLALSLASL